MAKFIQLQFKTPTSVNVSKQQIWEN